MKKFLLIIAVIIVLSGCGKTDTLTCSTSNTVGNLTSKTTYKIDYMDDEVKMLTVTYEYNDKHTDGVGTGTDGTTNDDDDNTGNNTTDNNNNAGNTTDNDNDMTNNTDNNMTNDNGNNDNDGIIGGMVGEALDDVITGTANGILDITGIKGAHNNRFGAYSNVEGFKSSIDTDNDNDYKVTYTYDLSKLSDTDLATFGIDRDFNTLKSTYTDRGLSCK